MSASPLKRLQNRIAEIRKADVSLTASLNAGLMSKLDRATARQGMYVLATRHFERFLEDQLIGLASGSHRWLPRVVDGDRRMVRSRVKSVSATTISNMLTMNREYFDPLPWDRGVEDAAKKFLYSGHPFTLVPSSDKVAIKKISSVRNCIAHDSESARVKMQKALSNIGGISQRHKRVPIRYLDHMFSVTDDYFTHDLRTMLRVALLLA